MMVLKYHVQKLMHVAIYSLHVLLFALVLAVYVHAYVHLVKLIFDFSYLVTVRLN